MESGELIEVRCYSGHTYAERPVAFFWRGEEIDVDQILSSWREPTGPVFRVGTPRGVFRLAYNERDRRWHLRAADGAEASTPGALT
jgi:hypothetical protein